MSGAVEVEILSKETIKPSFPTPHQLRNFQLSILDQIALPVYISNIFLYKANDEDDGDLDAKTERISQRLKSSLSETLAQFYPFAGKIKDEVSIECNDDGVEYIEARANRLLSEYLQKPDQNILKEFHPFDTENPIGSTGPILIVQVTFFKCGGVALEISSSHKLIDGMSLATFINIWAATARGQSSKAIMVPEFVTASIFPPSEFFMAFPVHLSRCEQIRFVFDPSKINELKAKVASASVPKPSRVEALTALIWKCARDVSGSTRGSTRASLLVHAVNLRTLVVPPLPNNSVGNNVGYLSAQTSDKEIELHELACILRKAKEEFSKNGLQNLLETKSIFNIPESIKDKLERNEIDFFTFSSVLRFPFYEAAEFGWGKPLHVTFPNYVFPNLFLLIDTKDGEGIEALVTLKKEDMALFECNQELLEFATVNPPIN